MCFELRVLERRRVGWGGGGWRGAIPMVKAQDDFVMAYFVAHQRHGMGTHCILKLDPVGRSQHPERLPRHTDTTWSGFTGAKNTWGHLVVLDNQI